jgi:uncharacterized membrane protein
MEPTTEIPKAYYHTDKKMYATGNLIGGAVLGGLLAVLYMVYKNYQAVGDIEKANKTISRGIPATIIIYGVILYLIPDDTSVSFIVGVCAGWAANSAQDTLIKKHKNNSGQLYSVWNALLVVLVAILVIWFVIALLILLGLI